MEKDEKQTDTERKEQDVLKRLLSTPPKPRTQSSDKSKKRGRPPKAKKAGD
jgi:hypothetical protein